MSESRRVMLVTGSTDGIGKQILGDIANPWDSVLWNIADWYKAS